MPIIGSRCKDIYKKSYNMPIFNSNPVLSENSDCENELNEESEIK